MVLSVLTPDKNKAKSILDDTTKSVQLFTIQFQILVFCNIYLCVTTTYGPEKIVIMGNKCVVKDKATKTLRYG